MREWQGAPGALGRTLLAVGVVVVAAVSAACSQPKTAASVLEAAQQAMGNPTSIRYSGTGMNAFVGQALTAGQEWPRRDMTAYARTIDYDKRASREEMTFAQPVFGGQQQNTEVVGDKAWNIGANGPVPQPAAAEERQLQIWLTPHGFIKGAQQAGNATLSAPEGSTESVVSFTALGKYKVDGTIDASNKVTRVATTIANPVMGDMPVIATYSDYKDFSGLQFPGRIAIEQGGFPAWELTISEVAANPGLELPVPDAVASATVPPVQVTSTQLAPGVWHLTGGSHHSVVVEFADNTAVIEAPLSEERSLAVLAEARRLVPNKPVRYVLTTHHHFDHTGGLRTYAAEGVTIVTHASNVPYFEKTLVAPATVAPDSQAKAQKAPIFQSVSDTFELSDGRQKINVYATGGDTHTNEYTLIYLPGPRILVEGDAYSPGPPDAPVPATPPPNAVKLNDEIARLKLNVATIAPIHGRGAVPVAELRKFIGVR
jgi:glyoxylase-like metal-dependent hydrolase (beta-lactamase superfamily II)